MDWPREGIFREYLCLINTAVYGCGAIRRLSIGMYRPQKEQQAIDKKVPGGQTLKRMKRKLLDHHPKTEREHLNIEKLTALIVL